MTVYLRDPVDNTFEMRLYSRYLLAFNLVFLIQVSGSQSLIRNGDFEEHKPMPGEFNNVYLPRTTIEYLSDWEIFEHHPVYCHKDYKKRIGDQAYKRAGYLYFSDTMQMHSGEGMVKLYYHESFYRPNIDTGGADYITMPLRHPLVPGDVYKVSMWVYLPAQSMIDSFLDTHIGFYLSVKRPVARHGGMIYTDYFFAEKIETNRWVYIEKYVRALCALKHFTIGAFRDETFPSSHRFIYNPAEYYIDDVEFIRIDESTVPDSIVPTPYCEYYEKEARSKPTLEEKRVDIYFESNDSLLDAQDQLTLDSFYAESEIEHGFTYVMTGHTDNEGNDNYNLSVARLKSVENYLRAKYGFSEFKFIAFPRADNDPIGDNRTDTGKQMNRRVTIWNTYYKTHTAVYRKGIAYLNHGDYINTLRTFRIWINTQPAEKRIEILHDVRLDALKKSVYWKRLVDEVRKTFQDYSKPDDAFFLDSMYWVDQLHRTYAPRMLTGYFPGLDTFDLCAYRLEPEDFKRIDSINFIPVRKYLKEKGFPKISEVGRRQVKAVCYMIIHNEDTAMMRTYLPLLESRCIEGEAEWLPYAIMFDSYLLSQGLPQQYGLKYEAIDEEKTQFKLYRFDDLDAVNERRVRIGIGPIKNPEEVITIKRN